MLTCVCVCALQGLTENMGYLVGDCLLAASFLSYMGPFLSSYRDELLIYWMKEVRKNYLQTRDKPSHHQHIVSWFTCQ